MKVNEIKYNISKDYAKLYELMKSGSRIVGFLKIDVRGVKRADLCRIIEIWYDKEFRTFNFHGSVFEPMLDKERIIGIMDRELVGYIMPNKKASN